MQGREGKKQHKQSSKDGDHKSPEKEPTYQLAWVLRTFWFLVHGSSLLFKSWLHFLLALGSWEIFWSSKYIIPFFLKVAYNHDKLQWVMDTPDITEEWATTVPARQQRNKRITLQHIFLFMTYCCFIISLHCFQGRIELSVQNTIPIIQGYSRQES